MLRLLLLATLAVLASSQTAQQPHADTTPPLTDMEYNTEVAANTTTYPEVVTTVVPTIVNLTTPSAGNVTTLPTDNVTTTASPSSASLASLSAALLCLSWMVIS